MSFHHSPWINAVTLVVASGLATPAWADDGNSTTGTTEAGPHRRGFTLELGLGAAGTTAAYGSSYGQTHYGSGGFGLSGLSLSVGGYITPKIALVARAAGTSFWSDYGNGTKQIVNGVYGASMVAWLGDFFGSIGPGLAVFGSPLDSSATMLKGFGLDGRFGYAFVNTRHNALTVGVESLYGFYSNAVVSGGAVNLEWHYF